MPLQIVQGNIVKASTQAIVNAANSGLWEGAGVCGAIFEAVRKAGGHTDLTNACKKIGHCEEGSAVLTPSFGLPAEHIIHAVGPKWSPRHQLPAQLNDAQRMSANTLANTYRSILQICQTDGISSVTIPAISTGVFGFPKEFGAAIAVRVCEKESGDIDVNLIAFSEADLKDFQNPPTKTTAAFLEELGI